MGVFRIIKSRNIDRAEYIYFEDSLILSILVFPVIYNLALRFQEKRRQGYVNINIIGIALVRCINGF